MVDKPVPELYGIRQECCDNPSRQAQEGETAKSQGLLWLWYKCKNCSSGIWLWVRFLTDEEQNND